MGSITRIDSGPSPCAVIRLEDISKSFTLPDGRRFEAVQHLSLQIVRRQHAGAPSGQAVRRKGGMRRSRPPDTRLPSAAVVVRRGPAAA